MRLFLLSFFAASLFFAAISFLPQKVFAEPITCNPGGFVACPNSGDLCTPHASFGFVCADSSGRIYGVDLNAGLNGQGLEAWEDKCYTEINGTKVATLQGFGCIFRRILEVVVPLLGLALFVLLLVGGFQYMTAGGDPKQTQKASGTITTAIIGIVVVIGTWFIFKILEALTGIDFLNFVIPG